MNSSTHPLTGLWKPHHLKHLFYGPQCVSKNLVKTLPTPNSKAFIITGSSLANKTPLVKDLEGLLGRHHAGTFEGIGQHVPIANLDAATNDLSDPSIDTLISLGGGSPIDSAKALVHRLSTNSSKPPVTHIAIPTTLSAAECTALAGYTLANGTKTSVSHPTLAPSAIFYDPDFAAHTPTRLWLATGMRALDHAVELMYHPSVSEVPGKVMARWAAGELVGLLPKAHANPHDTDLTTHLFLAAFASLGFLGLNTTAPLGLSHTLGYALGSPYGIPHGETSCMTLAPVVALKSLDPGAAAQISTLLPAISGGKVARSGNDAQDAREVSRRIEVLVRDLGLRKGLKERDVEKREVGIIVQQATGGKGGEEVLGRVERLVEGLFY